MADPTEPGSIATPVPAPAAPAATASADAASAARAAVLSNVPDRPLWQLLLGIGAAAAVGTVLYRALSPDRKETVKSIGELARDFAAAEVRAEVAERVPAYAGLGRLLTDVSPLALPRALNRAPRKKKCRPELPEELPEDAELVDAVEEVS